MTANVLPKLQSASLISLGQLCDDNCDINLNKTSIRVFKNKQKILQGKRNPNDRLWDIPIPVSIEPKQHSMAVIIQKSKTKQDLIKFYHAACFSPSIPTFYKAVKNGNFQSWPGLTPELIIKYLQPLIATHYGHLKQERQNLQSTQQPTDKNFCPENDIHNEPTNQMMATIVPYQITQKAFGDLPGTFPHTSSRGSQYFLVVYHYDSNGILVKTLKNRTEQEIKNAYMNIYHLLAKRGCAPKTFILDNETSQTILNAFKREKITYHAVLQVWFVEINIKWLK